MSFYRKPKVPFEFRNASEWDPDKPEVDERTPRATSQNQLQAPALPAQSLHVDDDGFQKVVRRFTKETARLEREKAERRSNMTAHTASPSITAKSLNAGVKAVKPKATPPTGTMKAPPVENSLPQRPPPGKPYVPTSNIFHFEKDNAARAAFRQRQEAPGSFELHKDVIEIELDPSRLQKVLHDIGVRCDSFIRPPQTANDRKLLIWGNEKQISKTQGDLRLWIRQLEHTQNDKPIAKDKFAKIESVIGHQYKSTRKETAIKAAIARFQQNPDPDEQFEYGGVYRWPNEEIGPQELFGSSLEAFDGIRYASKTHMIFDDRLRMIRLYSNADGAVGEVLKLIEGTLKEFYARGALDTQSKSIILVDITQCKSMSMVGLHQHQVGPAKYHIPTLQNTVVYENGDRDWEAKANETDVLNTARTQQALQFSLPHLKHFRGHVRIRLHIGTFALIKFRWTSEKPLTSSIAIEEFLANMNQSGTNGILLRSLDAQNHALRVLKMIRQSTQVFEPLDGLNVSLYKVVPAYGGQFVIHRFEKSSLQLQVDWTSSEQGQYSKSQSAWSNFDQKGNNIPLNIFTVRLGGDLSSKLQISRENLLDNSRVDEKMMDFESSVKMDDKVSKVGAELDGRRLVKWETAQPGCLKPSLFEQKTAFRYRVKNMPEAIFEVARYDSYDLSKDSQKPSATSWGASLWHTEWDMILSENTRLSVGEKAGWYPSLDTFFPDDPSNDFENVKHYRGIHPGLSRFLRNVQLVAQRLGEYGQSAA